MVLRYSIKIMNVQMIFLQSKCSDCQKIHTKTFYIKDGIILHHTEDGFYLN